MNEGDAASWKEQLLEDALATAQANNTELKLGSFAQFKHELQEAFAPYDSPGDALEKMKMLWMKREDSIDEHIAKFRMMVSESKLDKSSPVIIDLFRETLSMPLQKRILTLESPPKKLDDWYEWATKLDHQWRRMMRIMGRNNTNQGQGKAGPSNRRFFQREKDPNAMEIDSLSVDEQTKLMKEGKHFICRLGLTTSALVSNSHSDSRVFWLRKAKLGLARIFSHEYSHSRVRVLQVSQVLMKILAKNDKKYILNFNLIIPIIIIIIIMDPICWHTASTIIPDAAVLGCCHHV